MLEAIVGEAQRLLAPHIRLLEAPLIGPPERLMRALRALALTDSGGVRQTDVLLLGVHGMGGVGKSTLVAAVYDEAGRCFRGRCVLLSVGEGCSSAADLRKKRRELMKDLSGSGRQPMGVGDAKERAALRTALSTGGALMLVLDDLWSKMQLHWLLACDDTEDPGAAIAKMPPGSRVLLASRSQDIVTVSGMAGKILPLSLLDDTSAVQLLCQEAFKQPQPPPPEEFSTAQLRQAMAICGGLPLALRVLGRQLRGVPPEGRQVLSLGLSMPAVGGSAFSACT